MVSFDQMGLGADLLKAVASMGFEEATPIQEQTIPLLLQGKDIIGQAQTGTGKTAAFGLPLIEMIDMSSEVVQGIVLAPTRELAVQVAEELNKIGQFKRVSTLPIYGGQDIERQIRGLRQRPAIIVATPGRLMDHMRRKTIRLQNIKMLVLDEADEMLNMGFVDDIETILQEVPSERQTVLFSATMPLSIQNLAKRFMSNPELISIKSKEVTVVNTEQEYIEVPENLKFDVFCRLLDLQVPDLAIVFGRTKRRVDELTEGLKKRGYSAEGIHGDLSQPRRDSVLRQFKEGTVELLVATDVAARGLDISGVSHVYNFDMPQDPEGYVHRIGRTGRAGKNGLATTFVTPREIGLLRNIENTTRRRMTRKPIPTIVEAFKGQLRLSIEKIQSVSEEDISKYKGAAEDLLEDTDSVTLLAAALKLLTKEPETKQIRLTEETQFRDRGSRNHSGRPAPRQHNSYEQKGRPKQGGNRNNPYNDRQPSFRNRPKP